MRQGLRWEFKAEKASACAHRRETFPGELHHTYLQQCKTWPSQDRCQCKGCRHILFYPAWGFQSINSFLSVCSARLRAVANDSLWTLTCAHMCVSTLEIARMCAPLMAAAKNLHSRPTWSLTSSHTPKQKTTNEWGPGPDHSSVSVYWRTWSVALLLSKLVTFIIYTSRLSTEKCYFLQLFDTVNLEVWSMNSWEPPQPLRQSTLLWHYMDEFTVSSCEDVLFMSLHLRNYLYLNTDSSDFCSKDKFAFKQ